MAQLNSLAVSVTTSAAQITGLPPYIRYLRIHNPTTSHALAYTIDGSTPAVNGNGITVGGSAPSTDIIDMQDGTSTINTANIQIIGAASLTATLLYSV